MNLQEFENKTKNTNKKSNMFVITGDGKEYPVESVSDINGKIYLASTISTSASMGKKGNKDQVGPPRQWTEKKLNELRELLKTGLSHKEVASRLQISLSNLSQIKKRYNIAKNNKK